jgi:hypothetical protein
MPDNDNSEEISNWCVDRREFIGSSVASGAFFSIGGASSVAGQEDRPGETLFTTASFSEDKIDSFVQTFATPEFYNNVANVEYLGETPQLSAFAKSMQEFPQDGNSHLVLSSGNASEADSPPSNFASTSVEGRSIQNYSPDNYDANDVAEIRIDFTIPAGAEGIKFEYQFGSDEPPTYTDSLFQDFFEAILILPNGTKTNIGTLPNGDPVTVGNAIEYSNEPGGGSQSPAPPLPEPQDITYNAVTELLTAERSLGGFQGETARLIVRVADASDGVFDSAVLLDNLRFAGDIDGGTGPVEQALNTHRDAVRDSLEEAIRLEAQAAADVYNEHGSVYADKFVNYLGYQAGVVDPATLDDEFRDTLEQTKTETDGDDTDRFATLYSFYDELYSQAAAVPESERQELFEQYMLGTHPEQENYLTYGGLTPAEAFETYEQEVFPEYKESFLTDLTDGDFTNQERQEIISFINARTSEIESALGQSERQAEETVNALIGDSAVTGKTFSVEVAETGAENTVEDQLLGTAVVSIGVIALKAIKASYVAAKSYKLLASAAKGYKIVKVAKASKIAKGLASGTKSALHGVHAINSALPTLSLKASGAVTTKSGILQNSAYIGSNLAKAEVWEAVVGGVPDVTSGLEGVAAWGVNQVVDEEDYKLIEQEGVSPQVCLQLSRRRAEITDLEVSDLNITDALNLPVIGDGPIYRYDDGWNGVETGSITIRNTGLEPFTPTPELTIEARNTPPNGKDSPTEFPVVLNEPVPRLEPGEERTLEFQYAAPLSVLGSDQYRLVAELYNSEDELTEEFETGVLDFDFGESFDVLSGVLGSGETAQEVHTPADDTNNVTYDLNYESSDLDLHITDDQGNHTGLNYATYEFENEIPNCTHSGDDGGTISNEYATIEDIQSSEYTVEAISKEFGTVIQSQDGDATAISTSDQAGSGVDSEFTIDTTEVSAAELESTVSLSSTSATLYKGSEATVSTDTTVDEAKGTDSLLGITISVGELTAASGDGVIPAENVSIEMNNFDLEAGDSTSVGLTVAIPSSLAAGTYTATMEATANNGETTDTGQLVVNVLPEGPDVTIGDGQNPPQDLDGDGLYEDVSGDGTLSQADVQLLYENLQSDAVQNHPKAFNFSGTDDPQSVTIDDVQALFAALTGGDK